MAVIEMLCMSIELLTYVSLLHLHETGEKHTPKSMPPWHANRHTMNTLLHTYQQA